MPPVLLIDSIHGVVSRLPCTECRVVRDIGEDLAGPAAAEAAHAVADVEEERLALLLAVVADIDAGGDLLCHHLLHGGLAQCVQFCGIDRLIA